MNKSIHYVKMSDEQEIYTVIYKPEETPIGHVHILHGLAEHIGRYEEFAQFLVLNGYVVSGHDHRGHGYTGIKQNQIGFFTDKDGFERVTEDVREVLHAVRKEITCESPILFAHSMGSFIGRRYIQKYGQSVSKIVLSGTGGPSGASGKVGKLLATGFSIVKGKQTENPLLDKMSFGKFNAAFKDGQTSFDWLSSDPSEVQKYIEDPMCGFVTSNQLFIDLLNGLDVIHDNKEIAHIPKKLPILMISGSKDPVSNDGKQVWVVANQYKKAGLIDITVVLVEEKRHELLNELGKEETFELVLQWMKKK
ncbi:alpha/beta fold hydrolase [Paenisporosarcina sp. TG20]|uniref:alpha/beta fold hydrolase n=1 Tax=Paenisporosarcina sp. TG20 TaxID=1211706 RepID=UPI00030C85A2|nr:alpha/beta hydrolase [Paenisporosarcina sp. TG20]